MRTTPTNWSRPRHGFPVDAVAQLVPRLKGHVDVLAGLIGPRHLGKPSTMEAAATYIERELTKIGEAVKRMPYAVEGTTASNLVVERHGKGKSAPEIVVVGAHYDTVPGTPGADDNASAVAMLLEVARLTAGLPTRRTVRFVAFPCEEPPHFYTQTMGSEQYARACHRAKERIVGMLCLEMVGFFSDAPHSQRIPEQIPRLLRRAFPRRGNFLTAVGNLKSIPLVYAFRRGFKAASRLPLYSIALPEAVHEIRLSDNGSFWDYGYPAVMITDTSFFRNPNYHLRSDTPDTLDYERLAAGTLGVAGAVRRISGA